MNNKISDKDKKDWEDFLSKDETLPNKDLNNFKDKHSKFEVYDLHGYSLDAANDKIRSLIIKAYNRGIQKIKIITGKGIHSDNEKNPYVSKNFGILKYSVPEYIYNNQDLMKLIREIKDAEIKDGGSGAFYIYLKKNSTI